MKRSVLLPTLSLLGGLAVPLAQAGTAEILREGSGPYFKLTLPQAIYGQALHAQLEDLRLLDSTGQALPWAWAEPDGPEAQWSSAQVPIFPLPDEAAANAALSTTVQIGPDGGVQWRTWSSSPPSLGTAARQWLIDTHRIPGSMLSLQMVLAPTEQGLFPLQIEASEDLQHWQTLVQHAAVLRLKRDGQSLEQTEVPLQAHSSRYLRLRWLGKPVSLLAVNVDHLTERLPPAPQTEWTAPRPPDRCDARSCTWRLPPQLPLDAVRLQLSQSNTVAKVSLFAEESVQAAAPPPRRRHHPLHGLRHRTPAASSPTTSLSSTRLWRGVLWRLPLPGSLSAESTHAELTLDGSHTEQLRLEARESIREWGTAPPSLSIGTQTRSLVFLARDAQPLRLSWGQAQAPGAALPLSQLMPLGPQNSPTATASVHLPALRFPAAAAASSASSASPTGSPTGAGSTDAQHTPWLWAALLGGLALLGLMAASLLKSVKAPANTAAEAEPQAKA